MIVRVLLLSLCLSLSSLSAIAQVCTQGNVRISQEEGRPLTRFELDDNFRELRNACTDTLSEVAVCDADGDTCFTPGNGLDNDQPTITAAGETLFEGTAGATDNIYFGGSASSQYFRWGRQSLNVFTELRGTAGDYVRHLVECGGGDCAIGLWDVLTSKSWYMRNEGSDDNTFEIGQGLTGCVFCIEDGAPAGTASFATTTGNATFGGDIFVADDNDVGLSGGARFNFDATGTDEVSLFGGDLIFEDNRYLGLGASAGRIEFDDLATDEVNILAANVGIQTSTPGGALDIANDVVLNPLQNFAFFKGDIDTAKWAMKLGGFKLSFGNDNNTEGWESWSHDGRTYYSKVRFGVDGGAPTLESYGGIQMGETTHTETLTLYGNINLRNTGDVGDFTRYATGTLGPAFFIQKSDTATIGSHSLIDDTDAMGALIFRGSDGTNFEIGAQVYAYACATTGANDMPGCFDFYTTPDGSASPSLTLTMESDGDLVVARGDIYADPDTSVGTNTAAFSGTGAGSKLGILTSTRAKAKDGTIRELGDALDTLLLLKPRRYDAVDRTVRRPDPDAEPTCWQHGPPTDRDAWSDGLMIVETCKPGERDVVIPGAVNRIGLFAEDLAGVEEGLVIRDDDTGEPVSIDYTIGVTTLLVGAVQELRAQVESQQQVINVLTQQVAALMQRGGQ